jgi:hypothetical protein
MSFCQVPLDPPPITFGQFVFCKGGKEPAGRPTLLVRLGGEVSPDVFDGGQALSTPG